MKTNADSGLIDTTWYKRRGYPHFDRQVSLEKANALVTNPTLIKKHAFLPFLSFAIKSRHYKKQSDGQRIRTVKERPVAFASHIDSHIYAYYGALLKQPYEETLADTGLSNSILAYRRFDPSKCNIDFAGEVFFEIEQRKNCHAVALDIKSFFDNIPHQELKSAWARLLDCDRLPADHFSVFKSITRWCNADRDDVFKSLGIGRRRQESWRGPLCTPAEFRKKIRDAGLLSTNLNSFGIPQGAPLSAMLSNIVMLQVDLAMVKAAIKSDVSYRRYSDDILLIGPLREVKKLERILGNSLCELNLKINSSKTQRSNFEISHSGHLVCDRGLQYLGFMFDGQKVTVRPETIAKSIQRMKRKVAASRRAARAAAKRGGDRLLRKTDLYAQHSHLGPSRKMRQSDRKKRHSSIYTYAKRAAARLDEDAIRKQFGRHWQRLTAAIEVANTDKKQS